MTKPRRSKIELTSEVIQGFVNACLIHKFDAATKSPEFHKEVWEMCCSPHPNVAVAAPRGHAKSTAVTLAYTLANILFQNRNFILIVSATEAQSVLFLGDIKKELSENDDITSLFGKVVFVKDTETDCIVQFEDGFTARIMAKGAEQKLRGLKWNSQRPNLIVIDDLEEDEAVVNQDRREKMKRWFYGALLPCRGPDGLIRMVGTILHMDSLLERLMPPSSSKMTIKEDLKEYSITKSPPWKSVRYRAHNPDFSKVLWPDMWSETTLKAKREDYRQQGIPEVYAQEYLNYPIDESNAFFRKTDFAPCKMEEVRKNPLNYYVGIDLAISEKERADYTVIVVAGVDDANRLYIADVIRSRMDSFEIIDNIFSVQQIYKPELITIESGAIEKAIGPFLRQEQLRRNVYLNLNPLVPTKDKQARARSLQARMRAGTVFFDKDSEWYPEYEQEFLRFPRDRHDDQVDATAWIGLSLDKMIEAPTLKELEDEQYNEELQAYQDEFDSGVNATTGY